MQECINLARISGFLLFMSCHQYHAVDSKVPRTTINQLIPSVNKPLKKPLNTDHFKLVHVPNKNQRQQTIEETAWTGSGWQCRMNNDSDLRPSLSEELRLKGTEQHAHETEH